MINMVDIQEILLLHFRNGESISSISRKLKLSRKTVRRYIDTHKKKIDNPYADNSIAQGLIQTYRYDSSKRKRKKLTQEIQDKIDYHLSENDKKRHQGLHKQLLKSIDIHELLSDEGMDIAYSTVSHYITKTTRKVNEAFIKQVYHPGYACEFDWGEVKLNINGQLMKFQLAVFTNSYSNYRYARLYNRQDSLCFVDSHIQYFSHVGRVIKEMVYDNMRVAVSKFIGKSHKEPTEALLEIAHYYNFKWRFCNARKGNEKGHVEKSVEYVRRKSFANNIDFIDLKSANNHLDLILNKINNKNLSVNKKAAKDLLEEEKNYMPKAKKAYVYFQTESSHVDKLSTIKFKQNSYSVPDRYVGKILSLHVFHDQIQIFDNDKLICIHQRSYRIHDWQIKLEHYIPTLEVKPGALHSSLAFKQADYRLQEIYNTHFKDNTKDFISLLGYVFTNKIDVGNLCSKVEEVSKLTPNDISIDKIMVLLERNDNDLMHNKSHTDSIDEIEECSQAFLERANTLYANYQ
ncbi:MAG: IS21 family transposase [Marinifilaceae bacterium]